MALHLKTLGIRSLSAAVFVILLVGSVMCNYFSFTLFFFVVSMIGLHEFYKIAEKLGAQPYKVIGFVSGILTYIVFLNIGFLAYLVVIKPILTPLPFIMPFIIFAVALFSKRANPIQNALFTIAGIIYAVLPFALLHNIQSFNEELFSKRIMGIIFLIWSNDTFAYLGGSLFGKHKMIPRISPGKTWEGTIFGILMTVGVSFLIQNYWIKEDKILWLIFGITVPILATIGDLVESMLKRQAGIKDSGNIMPGHGGVLDRFDSLIFVSPFVFVILTVYDINRFLFL